MTLSQPNQTGWYSPMVSPEHGVYVMLFVSFLVGAAASHQWTGATTLALICAIAGFQAEHPWVLQIKQRSSWKPRLLVWGTIYAGISLSLALYLAWQTPILLGLYCAAIAAFAVDAFSVFRRQQKSFTNELLTFAAVCLAAPFAYIATTGTWTIALLGLWLLNALFFSSAIFTVKLRKPKTASLTPGLIYHAIASVIIVGLWYFSALNLLSAVAFGVALLKFGVILWQLDWYRTAKIQQIAMLETSSALLFFAIVVLDVTVSNV
ncbi:MAG: YwiC-like family protein [Leptolyngbya sp. Prado105]|jgi:hypothetical protein|nr:YwiC-like family protein [Leptolyngbya sp. Prado105]